MKIVVIVTPILQLDALIVLRHRLVAVHVLAILSAQQMVVDAIIVSIPNVLAKIHHAEPFAQPVVRIYSI